MSLTDFRTYIKAIISSEDSTLTEHKYPFSSENVPASTFDYVYHIQYGSIASELSNNYFYTDDFPVDVMFFKRGFSDPKTALDGLLDVVESIRTALSNPTQSLTQSNIKKVWASGIEIQSPTLNQNYVIIKLKLSALIVASNNRSN